MRLNDFQMVVYDYVEGRLPSDCEEMQAISRELHELIEDVIQDVCYDNDIEDYSPEY